MKKLMELAADLDQGQTTARALVEGCIERASDPDGEGARVFISRNDDAARMDADHMDKLRSQGRHPSPFAGIPVSYKDLFDVAGEVTKAGSKILRDAPAAKRDCPSVARMRAAGFVQIGRTNMTEFAFSGVGINPHYDTPRNAYDRATGRIPGGSSSGAAVSLTDDMAAIALGTDTAGSCRIPAALNGVVGYKPTARRVPTNGVYPLASSLDSVGPLGNSVICCAVADAFLSGDTAGGVAPCDARNLRLGALQSFVLDNLDPEVASAYEASLKALSDAGARIEDVEIRELMEIPQIYAKGGLAPAEAYAWHRPMLEKSYDDYDPRVGSRIMLGEKQSASDYIDTKNARSRLIRAANAASRGFDALLMPSIPLVAPPFSAFEKDDDYIQINMRILRNTGVGNFLDRCAISIPCHKPDSGPVGLMLMGETGADRKLFSTAAAVEEVIDEMRNKG